MAKNTPAFQFYPQDFLGGVMLLSDEATGIYIKLLCALWIADNKLPMDFEKLSKVTLTSLETFDKSWHEIEDKFCVSANVISHPRFVAMIESRNKRQVSGSLNARKRYDKQDGSELVTYQPVTNPKDENKKEGSLSKVQKNEDRRMKNEDSRQVFKKPNLQDVKDYASEASLQIDEEAFVDFYESKGWKIGRNPMKDWKACARNWSRREAKETKKNAGQLTLREMPRQMRNEVTSLESAKRLIAKRESMEGGS